MIEIRCSSGDCAEADSAEGAVLAARTMMDEDAHAVATWGYEPTATFLFDGAFVAGPYTRKTLSHAVLS